MKKALLISALGSGLALGFAGPALADDKGKNDPWSLFGDAEVLDNPVALTSVCSTYPDLYGPGDCLSTYPAPPGTMTFGGVSFKVKKNMVFAEIVELSTWYNVTDDDCGGGSPRFSISLDTDGDGVSNGSVWVNIGPAGTFTNCPHGWQNTGNLVSDPDGRVDTTPGGFVYGRTFAQVSAAFGSARVLGISLVVDSGWQTEASNGDGEQTILIANTSVNGAKLGSGNNGSN